MEKYNVVFEYFVRYEDNKGVSTYPGGKNKVCFENHIYEGDSVEEIKKAFEEEEFDFPKELIEENKKIKEYGRELNYIYKWDVDDNDDERAEVVYSRKSSDVKLIIGVRNSYNKLYENYSHKELKKIFALSDEEYKKMYDLSSEKDELDEIKEIQSWTTDCETVLFEKILDKLHDCTFTKKLIFHDGWFFILYEVKGNFEVGVLDFMIKIHDDEKISLPEKKRGYYIKDHDNDYSTIRARGDEYNFLCALVEGLRLAEAQNNSYREFI